MSVQLDHAMVPARDRKAAAQLLATLLGVPWAESGVGPFCPVYVSDSLTLDFDQADGAFPVLHYCFRVSEAEFDGILSRIRAWVASCPDFDQIRENGKTLHRRPEGAIGRKKCH